MESADSDIIKETLVVDYIVEKGEEGYDSAFRSALEHAKALEEQRGVPVYFLRYNDTDRQTVHSTQARIQVVEDEDKN